jgi:PilZ domain
MMRAVAATFRRSDPVAAPEDKRRSPRIPFEQLRTEMEIGGVTYPVQVHDLSQEGMRIVLESPAEINPDQEVKIAVGRISPNVRGRVRWVSQGRSGQPAQMGIEFESFVLEAPAEDEVEGLLAAWREISHTYTIFESFLHILLSLDYEIVEGKIDDLSDVIYSITVWLDQRVGPLNLWGVLKEPDGSLTAQLVVARHALPAGEEAARHANVLQVAREELTGWFDGRPYLFGGDVVIEYLGDNEGQVDLLQRLAVLLSKRLQFWSKLLMKNISLQLFGEELERLQKK